MDYSRREFVGMLAAGAGVLCCGPRLEEPGGGSARLTARPGNPTGSVVTGINRLGLGTSRDGYLYVPAGYVPGRPAAFLMALHGAGIPAQGPLNLWSPYADARGFLLLSVDSANATWDAMQGRYGVDVAFIDSALKRAFSRVSVDPSRLAVSGFSDGATYALGLGLANGDLFPRTIANSPGGIVPSDTPDTGHTDFFFSHGVQDTILPIEFASRRIGSRLRQGDTPSRSSSSREATRSPPTLRRPRWHGCSASPPPLELDTRPQHVFSHQQLGLAAMDEPGREDAHARAKYDIGEPVSVVVHPGIRGERGQGEKDRVVPLALDLARE